MKYYILIVFALLFAITGRAQIDSRNNSLAIPAVETNDSIQDNELDIKPITPKLDNQVGKKDAPKPEELPKAKRKAFTIVKENKYGNPAELFDKQLKESLKLRADYERRNNGSKSDQFLGETITIAKRVNIIYRDHQYPDGDLIRVLVNGKVAQSRVLLTSGYKGFFLNLKPGVNKIDFEALNQGTSGPNTAEFKVLDDQGVVISTNQWNLATGVKATLMVVKAEEED